MTFSSKGVNWTQKTRISRCFSTSCSHAPTGHIDSFRVKVHLGCCLLPWSDSSPDSELLSFSSFSRFFFFFLLLCFLCFLCFFFCEPRSSCLLLSEVALCFAVAPSPASPPPVALTHTHKQTQNKHTLIFITFRSWHIKTGLKIGSKMFGLRFKV